MYEHIVAFKFKQSLSPDKERELLKELLDFRGNIPGIVDLSAGYNVTHETDNIHGYTLGLRITFETREALLAYGPHPVHQKFVSLLDGLVDQVIVLDYEIKL